MYVFCFIVTYPVSKKDAIGTYVNQNYERLCVAEISDKPDTLILYDNNKFISLYYGSGEYEITGTKINLTYNYEFGKAVINASFAKGLF